MNNGWTLERRKRQAEMIKTWRPWEKSTGPKTAEGKQASAKRGHKGGRREILRSLSRKLRTQQRELDVALLIGLRESGVDMQDKVTGL